MKTLYFHMGWRKTGTSAIQSFLTNNVSDNMIGDVCVIPVGQKAQGMVVGGRPLAHHPLVRWPAGSWHAGWGKAADFVSFSTAGRFLMTTEVLPGRIEKHPAFLGALAEKLRIFDRVVFLFWVRRQDEYINSLYVQLAKHGKNNGEASDLAGEFMDSDYHAVLAKLENAVTGAEFRPHFYSGPGSDVVGGLIEDLELDASRLDRSVPPKLNARVTPEMYRAQIEVNRRAGTAGIRTAPLQAVMVKAYEKTESHRNGGPAIPISIQDRRDILDRHSESNRLLCDRFRFSPALFELPKGERLASLDQNIPDHIPAGFHAEMSDALGEISDLKNRDSVGFILATMQAIVR
ncbi:MAG: hypothetical protein H0T48_13955 [Gemmatimonadaceae bacterium]|nr:hypothetical protein [Gemmatimonadaceae bacterium]